VLPFQRLDLLLLLVDLLPQASDLEHQIVESHRACTGRCCKREGRSQKQRGDA